MNNHSNSPSSARPMPIRDDRETPNLDPIRDDPEPMLEPALGPPRKKPWQVNEGSDEGKEKIANDIQSKLRQANAATGAHVYGAKNAHSAAKAKSQLSVTELAEIQKARERARIKAAMPGHDLRDF